MEAKTENNTPEHLWKKGQPSPNPNGRPPMTEADRIKKKATQQLIEEYKEALGESLTLIRPVLIEKAINGDVSAIKEIHDRVMDKAKQPTDMKVSGELNINVISYGNNNTPQVQS